MIGQGLWLGIGGRRRGGAFRPNFYVDSVNGSDSNDGLTEATALQSASAVEAAALSFGNGVKISFARNDLANPWDAHFRQMLDLSSLTVVQIRSHGDPTKPLPKFSAADIAPAAGFTLVPTRANTYQITWTHEIGADYSKRKISAWKTGARLKWVASVDLCEAEANTYHVRTALIENPATIYINVGGGNPGTGDDCEITAREYAVNVGDGRDVREIHTCKQASHDGSFFAGKGYGYRILSDEGAVHNQWVAPGSVHEECCSGNLEPSWWRGLNGTGFITYAPDGSDEVTEYINCWSHSEADALSIHDAIYAHTNGGAATLAEIRVTGFRGYGARPAVAASNTSILRVKSAFLELLPDRPVSSIAVGAADADLIEVDDITILNAARAFGSGSNYDITDARVYCNGIVNGGIIFGENIRIRNSSFAFSPDVPQGVYRRIFNTTGAAVEFLDNAVSNAGECAVRALTADGIVSDRNVFRNSGFTAVFYIGSTRVGTIAEWRAATGEDINSSMAGSIADALFVDAANGDFTATSPIVDEGGRTAGSRKHIDRPDWAAIRAAWDAGFIAPLKFHVDSVSGSSSNDGLSESTAFASVADIPLANGVSVAFKKGSYFRESMATEDYSGIKVTTYGAGKKPVFDCADPAGAWTAHATLPNVWQQSWTHEYSAGKCYLSVWKEGERLRWISSAAALVAGRYYAPQPTGTTTPVYIYSATDPNLDAAGTWEITRRLHGVSVNSGSRVEGVRCKRPLGNDGALVIGSECEAIDCISEDGTVHNVFLGPDAKATGVIAVGGDWPDRSVFTAFVAYTGDGTGKSFEFNRCVAKLDPAKLASGSIGFYCHTNGAGMEWAEGRFIDCGTYGAQDGISTADCLHVVNHRQRSEETRLAHRARHNGTFEILDPWYYFVAGGVVHIDGMFSTTSANPTGTINGLRAYVVPRGTTSAGIVQNGGTGAVSCERGIIFGDGTFTNFGYAAANVGVGFFTWSKMIAKAYARHLSWSDTTKITSDFNVWNPNDRISIADGVQRGFMNQYFEAEAPLDANSIVTSPVFLGSPAAGDFRLDPASPGVSLGCGLERPVIEYVEIPTDEDLLAA